VTSRDGSDPRFSSAAVFAPNGNALRKLVQPQLAALGWKAPGKWRRRDLFNWWCAPPATDFGPWNDYAFSSPPGAPFNGEVTTSSESRRAGVREDLFAGAIALIREQSSQFRSMEFVVFTDDGVRYRMSYDRNGKSNGFSVVIDAKATGFPSSAVLAPWNDCPATKCSVTGGGGAERTIALGSLAALESQMRECTGRPITFGIVTPTYFKMACDVLLVEVAGRVTKAKLLTSFDAETFRELFPVVTTRVPGYFSGGFFATYRREFDPYARPAAADAGETVRYPMVSIERPRLSRDGDKDLDIDIVHRPHGDCYFDIQTRHYNPPNDTVVRETLEDAIKPLAVKAEIWDGDPFKRWM
jgi:hypothetical protein